MKYYYPKKEKLAAYSTNDSVLIRESFPQFDNDTWYLEDPRSGGIRKFVFSEDIFGHDIDPIKVYLARKKEQNYSVKYIKEMYSVLSQTYMLTHCLTLLNTDFILEYVNGQHEWFMTLKDYLEFYGYKNEAVLKALSKIKYTEYDAREVASYTSMFKFDLIINAFYLDASQEDYVYYYPIFIWWKLGGALPFRSVELSFLLKDGLHFKNGKYFLDVPTAKDKLTNEINYCEFAISDELANMIIEYQRLVAYDADRLYLFSELEYEKRHQRRIKNRNNFIDPRTLSSILAEFYRNIVVNKYGKIAVLKNEEVIFSDDRIEKIMLGDLRHYVFYNMLTAGLDPFTIMKFARHKSVYSQVHYYSHIYNMSLGKIDVLSDEVLYSSLKRTIKSTNRTCSVFSERERIIKGLKKDDFATDSNNVLIEVLGGWCGGNLSCIDHGFECDSCDYFFPNLDDPENARRLEGKYNEELLNLKEICDSITLIYHKKTKDKSKLEQLCRLRESTVLKTATIKSRLMRIKGSNYA